MHWVSDNSELSPLGLTCALSHILKGVNMTKIKEFKHGYATFEKLFPSGMYLVQCYIGTELHDKIRCDDYQTAMQYYKAFSNIAKNS
jgi:hypothetical protein